MNQKVLFCSLCTVLLSACGSLEYSITSTSSTSTRGKTYGVVIEEGKNPVLAEYLRTQLRTAMAQHQMQEVPPSRAEVGVKLTYGTLSPSLQTHHYSVPVYGQIGGGTSTYSGTTSYNGSTAYTSGTVTETPTFGIVGSQSGSYTTAHFPYYVGLTAIDATALRKSGSRKYVWQTFATGVASTSDEKAHLTTLLQVAAPYIGTDLPKKVTGSK